MPSPIQKLSNSIVPQDWTNTTKKDKTRHCGTCPFIGLGIERFLTTLP